MVTHTPHHQRGQNMTTTSLWADGIPRQCVLEIQLVNGGWRFGLMDKRSGCWVDYDEYFFTTLGSRVTDPAVRAAMSLFEHSLKYHGVV